MEGLGRLFNAHYPADDDYVSLENASGVTFFVYEVDGSTTATISTATDASGTDVQTDDLIDHWYERSIDQSDGVWVAKTQTASEAVSLTDTTGDLGAIYVSAEMLRDTHTHVKCESDGSGIVFAVLHDLHVQRSPENLASVIA